MLRLGREQGLWALMVAVLAVASGCHTYAPIRSETIQPGTTLRLNLSSSVSEDLAYDTGQVEGTLLGIDQEAVTLAVWRADRSSRIEFNSTLDTLAVKQINILAMEEQQLSYWRTGVVAAGVGAGLYVLLDSLLRGGEAKGTWLGGEDGVALARMPVRLYLRR